MKVRITAFLLVLILTAALVMPAAAAQYSDLEGHWAEEYMLDLAEKGLLTGYNDETMRPNNVITTAELLVLLSRLYSPGETAAELILDHYYDFLADTLPESYLWAYDELSICLAAGIISEDELKSINLSGMAKKELFTVYTVRAMQIDTGLIDRADIDLDYTDAEAISTYCLPHVYFMTKAGIITGNEVGKFEPNTGVTRAVAAAIVSRALNYLGDDSRLIIEDYSDIELIFGLVRSFSAAQAELTVRGLDGIVRQYAIDESAILTDVLPGSFVTLSVKGSSVLRADVEDGVWKQGILTSRHVGGRQYITALEQDSDTDTNLYIEADSELIFDGRQVELSELKNGSYISYTVNEQQVIRLYAALTELTLEGRIAQLSYGSTVTFNVSDDSGTLWLLPLDMSKLPELKIGDISISLDRLSVDDDVVVTVSGGKVTSIVVKLATETVSGELTTMLTNASGTVWLIETERQQSRELRLDYNVKLSKGGKSITTADVRIGDTITAIIYGDTVNTIEVKSPSSDTAATKLSGTVLAVDNSKRIITLLENGRLYYVDVSSAGMIIDAPGGKSIKLSAIENDARLVAYGVLSSSTNIQAATIIIE